MPILRKFVSDVRIIKIKNHYYVGTYIIPLIINVFFWLLYKVNVIGKCEHGISINSFLTEFQILINLNYPLHAKVLNHPYYNNNVMFVITQKMDTKNVKE